MTTTTIYKAGVPSVTGTSTLSNGFTASSPVTKAVYGDTQAGTVKSAYTSNTNVYHGANSDNGTTQYGVKQAGSLNANGVLTVAPGRNTPQS
jgi:hypothetical protein